LARLSTEKRGRLRYLAPRRPKPLPRGQLWLVALGRWALASALCLASTTLLSCGKHADDNPGADAQPVPEVTLTKVKRTAISQELMVSGNLAALPNQDAKIAALVPGRIARVLVTEGDPVRSGQALAELDSVSLRDQLHQAEAALAQARANLENARLSAQRNENLLQRGIAARKEVEDARTQLAVSESTLKQAEAALSVARTQVSRAVIRAPFDGTVVHRFLGVGELVDGAGSQPIVEVANIGALELLGTVPASRLAEIKVGEQFTFQTSSAPGTSFPAHVVAVLPAVDPSTNNGTVRIRVDNRKRLLKLGMFVSIQLPLKAAGQRLVLPRQAIYPDESGEPRVYKVQGEQAESVAVQLGVQTRDQVEVLSGVREGDTVILAGGYGLPEKRQRIRIKP